MELLIKGARIVDGSTDFFGDLYIKDGLINLIGKDINVNCRTIEGEGLVLLPSFTDLHAHFRDPGPTYKEDLLSGSRAAVKGGYTYVNLMANTKPVCSNMEIVNYVKNQIAEIGLIDVHQVVSVTKDFDGSDISHIGEIDDTIKFLSEDGKGVENNEVMLRAMIKAKEKKLGIMSHAEFSELNKYDTRLSENLMTIRDIELASFTGCHLHMCHVSTKEAMGNIIAAKKRGVNVTCEVTPHHIGLIDSPYRVNPPIRHKEDVAFLINSITQDYVDAIGTDHAPHSEEDKQNGAPGLSGIETSFSVCYTNLVKEGHITLNKLTEIMAKNPAVLMGTNKGQIKPGYDGDIVLVDISKSTKVESKVFESKGKNTPFDGMELYGQVITTIKAGKVVYDRGMFYDNR